MAASSAQKSGLDKTKNMLFHSAHAYSSAKLPPVDSSKSLQYLRCYEGSKCQTRMELQPCMHFSDANDRSLQWSIHVIYSTSCLHVGIRNIVPRS